MATMLHTHPFLYERFREAKCTFREDEWSVGSIEVTLR
jgi:hypothetical protein